VGAARLAVWTSLVGSIRPHGPRCMVGLASTRVRWCSKRAAHFRRPVSYQCLMDVVVLCVASRWAGLCRNTPTFGSHCRNPCLVLAGQQACSGVALPLSLVGVVRVSAYAFHMAA